MKTYLYDCILRITDDSSHIIRDMRNMILHMNIPMLCLLWGIMLLVYLDVFNQIVGNPAKYSFVVGKTMFEALFYSLFFVMWNEFIRNTSWRTRVSILNTGIKRVKQLNLNRNQVLILLFVIYDHVLILMYTNISLYIFHQENNHN